MPNFLLALGVLAETAMVAALPRRFVALHATRFGVVGFEPPLRLPSFRLNAVVPKAAMTDAGLAWILGVLGEAQEWKPQGTTPAQPSARRPKQR